MHIAVLSLDNPIPGYTERFGAFSTQTAALLKPHTTLPLKTYDTINGSYPNLQGEEPIAGIVLCGSRSDAFSDTPWIRQLIEWVQEVIEHHPSIPLVGICFGHQIIGRALGATVSRSPLGWELGLTPIEINPAFWDAWLAIDAQITIHACWSVYESHRDILEALPESYPEVVLMGATAKCSHQGMFAFTKRLKVFLVQGHPEFTAEGAAYLMQKMHGQAPVPGASERSLGDAIAKLMVTFITQAQQAALAEHATQE